MKKKSFITSAPIPSYIYIHMRRGRNAGVCLHDSHALFISIVKRNCKSKYSFVTLVNVYVDLLVFTRIVGTS